MQDERNAAPAGESAPEPVSFDLDAAASALEAMETPDDQAAPETQSKDQPTEGSEEPEETTQASEEDEPGAPDEESEPGQDDPDDEEVIHGNKYVVLRDGSKVRVGELKKLWDKAPEFERREQELSTRQQHIAAETQKFQAAQAQIAQQAQILQQLGPVVLAKAKAALPPEPNPNLMDESHPDFDPVKYGLDKFKYENGMRELQQIQQGLTTFAQQQQAEAQRLTAAQQQKLAAEKAQWAQQEFGTLLEARPELKDPAKMKAFGQKITKAAEAYGFTAEHLKAIEDHRLPLMLADLADLHALRSQKQAVQKKVATVPPVRAPGRRISDGEVSAQQRKDVFERANSGSIEDVASAIEALKL